MPFVSGSQGSGLLGRVFTAIGNSKAPNLRHTALSPQGDVGYTNLFGDYNTLLGDQKSNLADFTSQYKGLTPQVAGLNQQDVATYNDLIKKATGRDPIADMAAIGDYGFGKLKDFGTQLYDYGLNQDNQRLAAAGYGDRNPATNYAKILQSSRITGNLLPAFNNIISNIGPNYSRASQDYFNTLQAIPALMGGRYNALDMAPARALVPSQIAQANLQSNIGNLGNLTQGQLNNWQFYVKPNAWQTAGNVASGVYGAIFDAADAANKVSSAYGNVMTSGLGGMGGGMGGGDSGGIERPNAGGFPNTGTPEGPGQGTGENYPMNPQSTSAFVPNPYQSQSYASPYGGYGVSYAQPAPQYSPYGLSAMSVAPVYGGYGVSYNQNPYAQYGGYFQ